MTTNTPPSVDLATIQKVAETRVVEGIRLPFTKRRYGPSIAVSDHEIVQLPDWQEAGEVFIDADTLLAAAEQGEWDSQFGEPFLLPTDQGYALEQAGLVVQETKGGYHGTDALKELVRRFGWA